MSSLAKEKILQWMFDPYLFVVEAIGAKELKDKKANPHIKVITSQQKRFLNDLGHFVKARKDKEKGNVLSELQQELNKKTGFSIKSGKGSGKTATLAWCVIWFLMCYEDSLIACTATKLDQVKDVLWREIAKWIEYSAVNGKYGSFIKNSLEMQGEKIFVKTGGASEKLNWYAIARSAGGQEKDDKPAETLQGLHARHMMIIADEASGIREGVFASLDQTLTDVCNFMIMTYNPTRTSGFAYNSQHRNRMEWICYRWNCEESENVDPESIERIARKYGKDSNAYRVSVQGLEPMGDSDSIIPLEWVMAAVEREIIPDEDDPLVVGVDVGRQGNDPSIILSRKGMRVNPDIERMNWDNTMRVVGKVAEFYADENPDIGGIDSIGVGAGVYDRLREIGINILPVNVAESASDKDKFERLRDELWWLLRLDFEQGLISIPEDDELIFELSNVKYETLSNGKIKVESKKQMKARGVESPNKADALVLTKYFNDRIYRKVSVDKLAYSGYKSMKPKTKSWLTI